jgi:putative heme-binding domain-containing protein
MIQSSLGDRRSTLPQQIDPPNPDVLDGYRSVSVRQLPATVRKGWIDWLSFLILQAEKQGDERVASEGIRALAMLEPSDPKTVDLLLTIASDKSHPTFDLHLLCALACCSGVRTAEASERTAEILFSVVRKVKQGGLYTDNQWPKRLQQLVSVLLAKDAALADAFSNVPGQCCPEDLVLLNAFPADTQAKIRDRMRRELLQISPREWSSTIVRYSLQSHPLSPDLINALRIAVAEPALKSIGIELLSSYPNEADYAIYLEALKDQDRNIWSWAWRGIQPLPVMTADEEWPVLAKLVSEVCNVTTPLPKDAVLSRARAAAGKLGIEKVPTSGNWPDWDVFLKENVSEENYHHLTFPMVKKDWNERLARAGVLTGNLDRGQTLFQQKCLNCHGGQSALGPSLSGVTKRFSRSDLGVAIFEPSRDISDRYKAVQILTVDGEILTGVVVYSAADGTTIYTAKGEMVRVNKSEIEELAYSTQSLMPSGLLDDNNDQELADLLAYLGSL